MRALQAAVKAEALSPPIASRVYAYVAVAMYEAAVPGERRLRSLAGQLRDLSPVPAPAQGRGAYDWPAVSAAAAGCRAAGSFDAASSATIDSFIALAESQARRRAAGVPESKLRRSTEYGLRVAEAVLAWAGRDGYATRTMPYTPPIGPGQWVPTPPGFGPPLEPYWGTLRTFVLASPDECEPPPPAPHGGAAFAAQAQAVYDVSVTLTDEQREIAAFWADGAGATGTPAGHWVLIQALIVEQLQMPFDRTVELLAKTNAAMADAFICCWDAKYRYNLLRPITAIRELIDPAWSPLLVTPPFPEYTSGHSVASGAAGRVMTGLLGTVAFVDDTHSSTFQARAFSSFEAAALEAADSRLYGGIHYPMAIIDGNDQGGCIEDLTLSRLRTR